MLHSDKRRVPVMAATGKGSNSGSQNRMAAVRRCGSAGHTVSRIAARDGRTPATTRATANAA